jgi:photosystem II stability/assembly factor-like uncharacterized protein
MLRVGMAVFGAVVLGAGLAGCAAPTTSASQPSVIPSAVMSSPAVPSSAPASSAPAASVLASSPIASVPVSVPSKPVGSPSQDVGDLEEFVQASATTWWATVVGNLSNQVYLVRTTDAGQHWHDVTPSLIVRHPTDGMSSDVLSADVAWLEIDANPTTPQLFRTSNGGQSWHALSPVPDGCTLQFVDASNGWCYAGQGTMGAMGIELYRTADGGATWKLISRTTGDGTEQTPDPLPFWCDKQLTLTSSDVGWASSFCNGDGAYLDTSTDGGVRWHAVTPPPFPAWADRSEGEGLSDPVANGTDVAVVGVGGVGPGGSVIDTSSDGGRTWHMHLLPAAPSNQFWNVDLFDPTHWRVTDGEEIISTDDAGAHWDRWTPAIALHDQYGPFDLDFMSPTIGTASDPADRTPLWSTIDGGKTWTKVVIDAGPYVLN